MSPIAPKGHNVGDGSRLLQSRAVGLRAAKCGRGRGELFPARERPNMGRIQGLG